MMSVKQSDLVAEVDERHVPKDLRDYNDIWIVWAPSLGKVARAPWQAGHMYPAEWAESKPVDPRTSYSEARSVADLPPSEIGETWPFPDEVPKSVEPAVLIPPASSDNDLVFVDFDDVRDPESGAITREVQEILDELGGYTEVSRSGEGLHTWIRGELPDGHGKFIEELDTEGQIEIYDRGRMTGGTWRHVEGTPLDSVPEMQSAIEALVARYETRECLSCGEVVRVAELSDISPRCPECDEPLQGQRESRENDADSHRSGVGDRNAYYELDIRDVADTGVFSRHKKNWQGPHPAHGSASPGWDEESTNFNVKPSDGVWYCFLHDVGGGALELAAVIEGVVRCPNADAVRHDDETLLKACIAARNRFSGELDGEKPPYRAIKAAAQHLDLEVKDDGSLGESAYRYAVEFIEEADLGDF